MQQNDTSISGIIISILFNDYYELDVIAGWSFIHSSDNIELH
jgi:hypothetical protein